MTQKNWEKIILTQRDALANITNFSSQLAQNMSSDDPSFELVEKILEESGKRV